MQVIMFDPMYDCYSSMCGRSGGVLVPVPLNPSDWSIPRGALAAAFSPRTKMLLINTPHNPTGEHGAQGSLQSKISGFRISEIWSRSATAKYTFAILVFRALRAATLLTEPTTC